MNRKLDVAPARSFLQCLKPRTRGSVGIGEGRDVANSRYCLDQDFLSFAVELGREEARARQLSDVGGDAPGLVVG
jgi:hypothetical protein